MEKRSLADKVKNIDGKESKLLASFNEASLDEERFLKQKAKVHWLAEGDANTKYFHNTLKCRNHRARIDVITDSNGSLHEGTAVPKAFVDHYVGFLGKEDLSIIPITQELFDARIDQAVAVHMIREVTVDEIKRTMFAFGNDKAPGPDGFTAAYLGVPLVASRVRTSDCRALIEKVDNRVGDWKNKLLSFAGRCQLINSVIASLHVFWSSVFILPIRIMHDIEAKMSDFLWARGPLKKGLVIRLFGMISGLNVKP
ncbi:hypothetical protein QVD17_06673 [Tagetes erecta]|uniref:RNA-directed DNA polymerase, eukaryota, reverse transcriptase zinc-binding domain protein n=1 Tax=Tagetes erecta TaxID=13708 RepID=A0AAD8LKN3_TARER|nr:hypothetical protein QVD17_06673 [Tagetes erecta]